MPITKQERGKIMRLAHTYALTCEAYGAKRQGLLLSHTTAEGENLRAYLNSLTGGDDAG